MRKDKINILLSNGNTVSYDVEVPETDSEFYNGLANRQFIPELTGMLYRFNYPNKASMFTPDTLIPVDFIFLDNAGNIIKIKHSAKPLSSKTTDCYSVGSVLEINGGDCKKYGIKVGDILYKRPLDKKEMFAFPQHLDGKFFVFGKNYYCITTTDDMYQYSYKAHRWLYVEKEIKWKFFEQEENLRKFVHRYFISRENAKTESVERDKELIKDFKINKKTYYQFSENIFLSYSVETGKIKYYSFEKGLKDLEHTSSLSRILDCIKWNSVRLTKSEFCEEIDIINRNYRNIKEKINLDKNNEAKLQDLRRIFGYPNARVFYKPDNLGGWKQACLAGSVNYLKIYLEKLKNKCGWKDFIIFGGNIGYSEINAGWDIKCNNAHGIHMTSNWLYDTDTNRWFILPDEKLPQPKNKPDKVDNLSFNIRFEPLDAYDVEPDESGDVSLSVNLYIKANKQEYRGYIDYYMMKNDIFKFIQDIIDGKEYAFLNIEEYTYTKMFAWKIDDNYRFLVQFWGNDDIENDIDVLINKNLFVEILTNLKRKLENGEKRTLKNFEKLKSVMHPVCFKKNKDLKPWQKQQKMDFISWFDRYSIKAGLNRKDDTFQELIHNSQPKEETSLGLNINFDNDILKFSFDTKYGKSEFLALFFGNNSEIINAAKLVHFLEAVVKEKECIYKDSELGKWYYHNFFYTKEIDNSKIRFIHITRREQFSNPHCDGLYKIYQDIIIDKKVFVKTFYNKMKNAMKNVIFNEVKKNKNNSYIKSNEDNYKALTVNSKIVTKFL